MRPNQLVTDNSKHDLYRLLPSLHELLLTPDFAALVETQSRDSAIHAARTVLARLKQEIGNGRHTQASLEGELAFMHVTVANQIARSARYRLRRVINATGVVLHTNLGRAPLSASALAHICDTAGGYSNLEFDLESGERSRRDVHTGELLLRVLTGGATTALSALVVNNCAAATFLALNTLAEGGEVIVSRGELVEIGGGFRIPDILAKSGAILHEVGTTNRTRLADYEGAISPATRLILRVHQSNFSMQGFVERPALRDLVSLGKQAKIPLFDDQGTGLVASLEPLGIASEPTLSESFQVGSNLIAASGDKLLGGPQCGLLIGSAELVQRIRKNPLYRTYRVDKLTYAALEATLIDYALQKDSTLPVQRMLQAAASEIFERCAWVSRQANCAELAAEAVPVQSLIGGGTAPTARLHSAAVSLRHAMLQPQALLLALRRLDPPVVGRVHDDHVLLDLRTVEPEFDQTLALLLQHIAAATSPLDLA
ncbi:MAG: L-seryl-tRNA(Sec) selenium transferase [Acidobacteriaceae bacterium]